MKFVNRKPLNFEIKIKSLKFSNQILSMIFFKNQLALRKWFIKNHLKKKEMILAYYKKATKKESVDWSQSVDEALCFGWIDGIRRKVDEEVYTIRFTPRKAKSHWSDVNLKKIEVLKDAGLMFPAGLAAFSKMDTKNSRQAAYEKKNIPVLDKKFEAQIKANKKAWEFFSNLAPSYKKVTINWLMSAKREETKLRRLKVLIESSEQGLKIPNLRN